MKPRQRSLPPARIARRHARTVASSVVAGPSRSLDPRLPVLVGLGGASAGAPVVDLMTEAVRAAAADAGAPGLLTSVECVMVPQGSWSLTDPARTVARRIGSPGARTVLCQVGVSQQEVINHALAAVAAGQFHTVVVVGGEARAWVRSGGVEDDEERRPPDELLTRPPDIVAPIERAAGIVLPPVLQYALIENALGAAEHLSADEQRDADRRAVGALQRGGRPQPRSCLSRAPRGPRRSPRPAPGNRPLAYPYNRWHASQWTVDQSSALLICSAEQAQAAGVPPERWLFPHVALHCSEAVTLTARRRLSAWPAMSVLGRTAEHHIGRPLRELRLAEVYSCFPAAVRVQQRALGLDPAGTPTLTGGMTLRGRPLQPLRPAVNGPAGTPAARRAGRSSAWSRPCRGLLSKPGLASGPASPPVAGRGPAPGRPGRRGDGGHPTSSRWSTAHRSGRRPPPWPPSPSPTAARRASSRSARPSWRTCPMGSAPPPPAKMHGPPASPSPRASSGGRSR